MQIEGHREVWESVGEHSIQMQQLLLQQWNSVCPCENRVWASIGNPAVNEKHTPRFGFLYELEETTASPE